MLARRWAVIVALGVGAAGCAGLIGADFDRSLKKSAGADDDDDDSRGDDNASDDDDSTPLDGASLADADEPTDAKAPVPAACGDMSGLDPKSPWPMGAYCPSRPSQTTAPPLKAPRLLWRYDIPDAKASIRAQPALGGDGTIYVPAFIGVDGSNLVHALIAIKNKALLFRTYLPGGLPGTPTLAKDGTIYVQTAKSLVALAPKSGSIKWSFPLGQVVGGSPAVLGDGTIVVLDGHDMVFVRPTGVEDGRYSLGSDAMSPSFFGSVATSPTGLLFAVARGPAGQLDGRLVAVNGSHQAVFTTPVTLNGNPQLSPNIDSKGNILVSSTKGFAMFTPQGASAGFTADGQFNEGPWGAKSGTTFWFTPAGASPGPLAYDTVTQALSKPEVSGRLSNFVVVADDSLVVARSAFGETPRTRLEGWAPNGDSRWVIALDDSGDDLQAAAIGADGTAYVGLGPTLYAIGD